MYFYFEPQVSQYFVEEDFKESAFVGIMEIRSEPASEVVLPIAREFLEPTLQPIPTVLFPGGNHLD